MSFRALSFLVCGFFTQFCFGKTVEYTFDISTSETAVAGVIVEALTINGQMPAPTLRASVGDTLRVTYNNKLNEVTSVHWHGILLPADQDGVSYLNTQPILPGKSHTFEFPITHAGTFWYHSHTNFQIQQGLYGAIVLDEAGESDGLQEEVLLLSDWTHSPVNRILKNLKSSDDFYTFQRGTVQSWDRVLANGQEAISNRLASSFSRMGPMDLADVYYDAFLTNGKTETAIPITNDTTKQIKLRVVNGSTSSYFDMEYAGGPMTIVAADGQDVEPLQVQRLRISTAETYDVTVSVEQDKAFEFRATSIDGSAYTSTFIGQGTRVFANDIATPNLFLTNHSTMDMASNSGHGMTVAQAPMDHSNSENEHSGHEMADPQSHSLSISDTMRMPHNETMASPQEVSVISHMTDYASLEAVDSTTLPAAQSWREIHLELTGSMERYVWGFNGKTFRESPQILIKKGENVRLHFNNQTMMHHPLHLHGHFFRVINGKGDRSPLKHTVNVPPMGHVMIEFDANEDQDWLFHCHNQFHMKSGMNRVVSYQDSSNFSQTIAEKLQASQRYFAINEFHLMTSFADYEFSLFDERHELRLEVESDLAGRNENYTTYNYHFNRFMSGFIGYQDREQEEEENRDVGVAGINLMLPFLIESEWRVDDDGEFRLELESNIPLTQSISVDWRWNTDDEYRYGINYRLNNRWAITFHTDKEYGDGVGVKFFY
ncbi:MAG: multicopper oxidase family protein [Pseudohongiellaceae bacterium]